MEEKESVVEERERERAKRWLLLSIHLTVSDRDHLVNYMYICKSQPTHKFHIITYWQVMCLKMTFSATIIRFDFKELFLYPRFALYEVVIKPPL